MDTKRFQKNIEDFTCDHCGKSVKGGGYTNHCPKCLWSKHVDINPCDRSDTCGGLMKPIDVETKEGEQILVQECEKCKHTRRNKIQENDDIEEVVRLSKNSAENKYPY